MNEVNIGSDIEEVKRKIAEISEQLGSNTISAEVIARYLETLQFPNNESEKYSDIILKKDIKDIINQKDILSFKFFGVVYF